MEPETAAADPFCPTCSNAVTWGSLVLFQHGELIHVRCASAEARAGAAQHVAQTKRPSEEGAWTQRKEFGSCGNCGELFRPAGGYIRRADGWPVHLSCSRAQ